MEQKGEDQLQLKQDYLKAEIIDKNLEPSKFLEFCTSQKENGDDLNNWTLSELEEIVKEFVIFQEQHNQNTQMLSNKIEER